MGILTYFCINQYIKFKIINIWSISIRLIDEREIAQHIRLDS